MPVRIIFNTLIKASKNLNKFYYIRKKVLSLFQSAVGIWLLDLNLHTFLGFVDYFTLIYVLSTRSTNLLSAPLIRMFTQLFPVLLLFFILSRIIFDDIKTSFSHACVTQKNNFCKYHASSVYTPLSALFIKKVTNT